MRFLKPLLKAFMVVGAFLLLFDLSTLAYTQVTGLAPFMHSVIVSPEDEIAYQGDLAAHELWQTEHVRHDQQVNQWFDNESNLTRYRVHAYALALAGRLRHLYQLPRYTEYESAFVYSDRINVAKHGTELVSERSIRFFTHLHDRFERLSGPPAERMDVFMGRVLAEELARACLSGSVPWWSSSCDRVSIQGEANILSYCGEILRMLTGDLSSFPEVVPDVASERPEPYVRPRPPRHHVLLTLSQSLSSGARFMYRALEGLGSLGLVLWLLGKLP